MKRLSLKEFDKRSQEILARMKTEATRFEDDSEEAKEKRRTRARHDRLWFMETYCPHYFYKPFGDFHRDLSSKLDISDEPAFFAGPRESGKTAEAALGTPMHDICFVLKHFIIIGSETDVQATDFTRFIKLEIEENERIKQDFGNLRGSYYWGDADFVTANNVRILARGRGQAFKGLRWRQYRPDRLVITDLENSKNVKNPKLVKEAISWLQGEVQGGMAEGYNMLMEGQIIAKRCVMSHFIEEKDESGELLHPSSVWKAIQDDGTSYWPEGFTKKQLDKKKKSMGTVEFNRWMQQRPADEEGSFREEWIKYYYPEEIIGRIERIYAFLDPSLKSNETSDYKALIIIGVDADRIIYVLHAYIQRCSPDAICRASYNRYEEFHPLQIGGEENNIGDFLWFAFDTLAKEKGYRLPLKPVTQSTNKEARIQSLSPRVERGKIRFQKGHSDQDRLVEQLIFHGQTGVHDDGPDALEGAVALVEDYAPIEAKSAGPSVMANQDW